MENIPLVSVICLCYNHEKFVAEALDSVLAQTYLNLEIIVVDDYSTDSSREIIQQYCKRFPEIRFIANDENLGNCKAFNRGFALSSGSYIIDFATDDVLLPARVAEQVAAFEDVGEDFGIQFTDALLIDDAGKNKGRFYKRDTTGNLLQPVPEGQVFAAVLRRHFICTPTMMMRRKLLEYLEGYDETLLYEDFDVWVRSAPFFKFQFLDKALTKRRIHPKQLSQRQYKLHDRQIFSTIAVCRKALNLIRTEEEKQALLTRLKLEFRQAILTENKAAASELLRLLSQLAKPAAVNKLLLKLLDMKLPLRTFRRLYYRLRYGKPG